MEDIYKQLKELEEHHVQAVRGLEKLAKALQHVRAARAELGDLREDGNLGSTLSDLPEQLTVVEDALEEETWRTRGYITDIELNQSYLRRRKDRRDPPSGFPALPKGQERTNASFSSSLRSSTRAIRRKKSTGICRLFFASLLCYVGPVSKLVGKRVLLLFVGLFFVVLSSCAQSASPDKASRENAGEEATSSVEDAAGEITGSSTSMSIPSSVPEPTQNTSTSPATGSSGMVSSANPLATRAGLEILAEGGNAFDAAVVVAAALNVVEPMMSGIGGYGGIMVYDADEEQTRFLHASSRMPATLDPQAFRPPTQNYVQNRRGAKAISTPGNANAWEALSRDYGELEWRRLFEPAIGLAEGGFPIGEITAGWISSQFPAFPEHARNIYGTNGVPLRAGETLVQEDLARSLRLIAEGGAGVVYEGELGEAIDATVRENGGFLTLEDLRDNRAEWREPTSIDYRGYEVVTASPPATSWGTLVRLGVMGELGPTSLGHNSAEYLHSYAEVTKRAYSQRIEYSRDPDISPTPLDRLLSEDFWAEEAAQVDPLRAAYQPPTTFTSLSNTREHTTHFVVADREGNVVSATQTLGNVFGSRTMPPGTGIWLNDSIAYSTWEPEDNPLDAFPGRYRLVGISPILVMSDGRPYIAIGTPGGFTILQTTPQMLMNLIDFDMDIQQAISEPRISFVEPDVLAVDGSLPESVRNELSARGHNVQVDQHWLGNAHGVTVEYDPEGEPVRFTGGSDPRGEGVAAGA